MDGWMERFKEKSSIFRELQKSKVWEGPDRVKYDGE